MSFGDVNLRDTNDPDVSAVRMTGLVSSLSDERGFLTTLLAASADAIFAQTLEGVILSWNLAAERLLGHADWEVVGRNEAMLLPRDRADATRPLLERARAGETVHATIERLCKDGTRARIAQVTAPIRDMTGRVVGAATLLRADPADSAVRLAHVHRLAEHASDVIFRYRVRPDRGFDYISPAITTLSGFAPEQHYADPELLWSLVHEDDRSTIERLLGSAATDGITSPVLLRLSPGQGRTIWTEMRCAPVLDETGTLEAIECIARDVTASRAAEQEMSEGAHRLELALRAANQGLLDLDLRSGIATISPEYARMLGEPSLREVTISRWRSWLHPDDAARMMLLVQDLTAGRRDTYESEYRILTKNGRTRCILSLGRVIERDARGLPARMIGTHADITELREAERATREMEDRHWTLFETMAQGAIYQDSGGGIVGANPAAAEILGVPLDRLLGRTTRDIWWPALREDGSDFPGSEHPPLIALRTGQDVNGVIMAVPNVREHRNRWILVYSRPRFRTGETAPYLVCTTFTDITVLTGAQSALRTSEERYRAIVENTPDVIARFDIDLRFVYISTAIRRYGDFQPTRFLGRTHTEAGYPADMAVRCDAAMRRVFEDGEPREDEFELPAPDGVRNVYWRVLPEFDRSGRVTTVVTIMQDVTARRQLEEQFRQAQKMEAVGRLAGGVAHDFNNLLTGIRSYASFLMQSLAGDDGRRADAVEIDRIAERAAALTRQLLAISRRQMMQPAVLDLARVVGGIEGMLRRLIGEDTRLVVTADEESGHVRADRGQLEQVIMNLVVNARDAMSKGGRIDVRIGNVDVAMEGDSASAPAEPERHVCLSVTDTGAGIPDDVRAHIFEPFYTTKQPGHGTGLGLSTVYGIVKQSGGDVMVESVVGEGTTFRILLPHVDEDETPTPAIDAGDVRGGDETILIAEDDDTVRALAVRALTDLGYHVLDADDAYAATALAETNAGHIDLLITDVIMPDMSGRQVARHVTLSNPHAAILYMSGYTDEIITRHRILGEEALFLEKPFTPSALGGAVRQALDQRTRYS